jgi:hypothetical protein
MKVITACGAYAGITAIALMISRGITKVIRQRQTNARIGNLADVKERQMCRLLVGNAAISDQGRIEQHAWLAQGGVTLRRHPGAQVGESYIQPDQQIVILKTEVLAIMCYRYLDATLPFWSLMNGPCLSSTLAKAQSLAFGWCSENIRASRAAHINTYNDAGISKIVHLAVSLYSFPNDDRIADAEFRSHWDSRETRQLVLNGRTMAGQFASFMGRNAEDRSEFFH